MFDFVGLREKGRRPKFDRDDLCKSKFGPKR